MVFGIPGTDDIAIFNKMSLDGISGVVSGLGLLTIMFIFVGAIFYWAYYLKKIKKKYDKQIFWFQEIHGEMVPIGNDKACEITIPGTNVQVFYIKSKDMYLPRPVKRMGKDAYWIAIRNNQELVNFVMKNINEEMKSANLDFDHTDMRYALTNLKDLIQRNYRDKSQPWWREYKDVIGLVVLIFVLTLSFIFIISKLGGVVDKIGALVGQVEQLMKIAELKQGSGVITQ